MKCHFLLIALLILPIAQAQNIENYNNYQALKLEYTLSSNINIQLANNPRLEYLNTKLNLFPLDSTIQKVIQSKETSNPESAIAKDESSISYTWSTLENKYTYTSEATIETENKIYQIPHIAFPLEEKLPDEVLMYTQPGKNIDITNPIINQANQIVEGQTDLYTIVFLLADWTKTNIKYDLNTLTAKAALPSSWVLKNREGVCDEMTSLFISMVRSLGVPARFISGSVYTNLGYSFGNHGWAEVYFPSIGWVPYDPTFGQYGWVDPSHIALSYTQDSAEPAVTLTWKANGLTVETEELKPEVKVVSSKKLVDPVYSLEIEVLENNVGPGSYVPFRVITKTPFPKYTSNTITLTTAPSLTESNVKSVLLEPNSDKSTYWIAQIDQNADPGFTYSTTLIAQDLFGSKTEAIINYAEDNPIITKEQAEEKITALKLQESKTYSEELSMSCSSSKKYYYSDEKGKISCNLKNTGNRLLSNIQVCFKDCNLLSLEISQEETIEFEINPENLPEPRVVTAKVEVIELIKPLSFTIFKEANLRIASIDIPDKANYKDKVEVKIRLDSSTLVNEIKISIKNKEIMELTSLEGSEFVTLNIPAKQLINGIELNIRYKDERGKDYSLTQKSDITIEKIPFYAKIINWFSNLV